MKILLLEDDYSLNETIKEMLESCDYKVDSFFDGLKAYNNISNNYDLYILDINTPNVEGIDILNFIKDTNPSSNVIMISAICDITKIREAYKLGCDDYIKKPFDVEELILKIERICKKKNSKIEIAENTFFYLKTKELYINNKQCILTKNEKYFIYLLVENIGKNINHSQIENFVYEGETKSYDSIKSMVKRIRKKIPENTILNNINEGYYIKKY